MNRAIIDFETYYDKDISTSTQGNTNYRRDAYAYMVAASVGTEVFCGTIEEMGSICEQIASDPTVQCWAFNSNFDQGWWEKYFPKTALDWKCGLDVGRFNQFPGNLEHLTRVVLGREEKVDKTMRDFMKGKHYANLTPTEQQQMQDYCLQDVVKGAEVLDAMPPMSSQEDRISAHTRLMNRRGVNINTDLVAEDKTRMEAMRFEAFKAIPWHSDAAPLSYPALSKWCVSKGIPVPKSTAKTDEDCADLMSEHPELNAVLLNLRRFRKANTLLKKVDTLLKRVDENGVMPLDIIYCGAPHTRRWSSKGFNIQNLDKVPMVMTGQLPAGFGQKGNPGWKEVTTGQIEIPGLSWVWTRNWITPPPGYEFLILDFAQVEPRVLNWLCGNDEMMEALRHGFSYYEAYYRSTRNWKGEPGTLKKQLGSVDAYTKLKNEALGCGYGMGWKKYISYAGVDEAEARRVITGFRNQNQKVVKFWSKLDNLIISAARDKSRHLGIAMPSGDLLQYFAIRAKSGKGYEGFTVKGDFSENSKQHNLWGGTLTENVTQRGARDALGEAVVRLEDNGFPVAFHAHDEVVLIVPIETDPAKRAEVKHLAERLTAQSPEWAPDLPLGVEGDYAPCYTKI